MAPQTASVQRLLRHMIHVISADILLIGDCRTEIALTLSSLKLRIGFHLYGLGDRYATTQSSNTYQI